MKRIATIAATIAVLLIPLMGAKSCGTSTTSTGSGAQAIPFPLHTFAVGQQIRVGDHVWWIGQVPPHPPQGTAWQPDGYTKRQHRPVWVRVAK